MLTDSDILPASLKMDRPPCPVCQWPLWMTAIQASEPGFEERTFICPRCDHEDVRKVVRSSTADGKNDAVLDHPCSELP